MFYFQEGRFDQVESTTLANAACYFAHVIVCLLPATAVANHEYS